jgi:NitT/TauT family transport system permease protein
MSKPQASPLEPDTSEAAKQAQPRRRSLLSLLDPLVFIIPLLFLIIWQVVSAIGIFPPLLVPSPAKIIAAMLEWFSGSFAAGPKSYFTGTWLQDAAGSTFRALTGFAIGSILAVSLGILVGWSRKMERLVDPSIQLLRPMPRTAFLPFAVIFFGLGNAPALFLVILGTFLQVYVQVVTGVKLLGRDYNRVAQMLGASHWQTLRLIIVPGALPHIFTGLRLGIAYAWTLLILAEMFAVPSGFGYTLWRGYEFSRMDIVVAGMLMIALFGYVSDRIIVIIARRSLDWAQEIGGGKL